MLDNFGLFNKLLSNHVLTNNAIGANDPQLVLRKGRSNKSDQI